MNKINIINYKQCIGATVFNNKNSTATIIDYRQGKYRNGECFYPPKFKLIFNDEYRYENWFRKNKVDYGQFRNPYEKSFFNIGMLGVKYNSKHFLFKRWIGMISRCYNSSHKSYSFYGGDGVKVCNEWMLFENYVDDVVTISGYEYDRVITGDLELDKDTFGGKLYSKETCLWISSSDNKQCWC